MGLFDKVFGKMLRHGKNDRKTEDVAFEKQVRADGVPHAAKRIAEILNEQINSRTLAEQFVLEELDAARQGGDIAQAFVKKSGYKRSQYIGAMQKSEWEGEESRLEHVQLLFRNFTYRIQDMDLMGDLMLATVDEVMKTWKLGRYNVEDDASRDNKANGSYSLISDNTSLVDAIITGFAHTSLTSDVKTFTNKIKKLAAQGDSVAIALACFVGEPISFKSMEEESLHIFTSLLGIERYSHIGFSDGVRKYFDINREIIKKSAQNNMYAQYIMGFWYAFDNHAQGEELCLKERQAWYEKAALNGMVDAMPRVAMLFDDPEWSFLEDHKKAAYWYRRAALNNNVMCAHNLGIMYLQGCGVKRNMKQAKLWLLHALTHANEDEKTQLIMSISRNRLSTNEIDCSLTLADDIELDPSSAELGKIYNT